MIFPASASSSPATSRRSVDFPHPLGPTSTANVPSGISRSTPLRMDVDPKLFLIPVAAQRSFTGFATTGTGVSAAAGLPSPDVDAAVEEEASDGMGRAIVAPVTGA